MIFGTQHAAAHANTTRYDARGKVAADGTDIERSDIVGHEPTGAEVADAKMEEARERRLKDTVRRYYALAELVETERGYVNDLKVLVEVYLASLGALPIPHTHTHAESPNAEHSFSADVNTNVPLPGPSSPRTRRDAQRHSYHYPPSSFPSYPTDVSAVAREAFPRESVLSREISFPRVAEVKTSHASVYAQAAVHYVPRAVASASAHGHGHYTPHSRMDLAQRHSGEWAGVGSASASESGSRPRGSIEWEHGLRSFDEVKPGSETGHVSSPLGCVQTRMRSSRRVSCDAYLRSPTSASASACTSASPSTVHTSHALPLNLTLRAALTDAERSLLARAAAEILTLHERILQHVEHALRVIQAQQARIGRGERSINVDRTLKKRHLDEKEPEHEGEGEKVETEVEEAVRAVCEVFVCEASNFVPYESFCAGHTEALDTTRRAMRAHASEWVEWEKQCAEIAAVVTMYSLGADDLAEQARLQQTHAQAQARLIVPRASRNSLFGSTGGGAGDADDALSSTSTLRRRHSACTSTGNLRTSTSVALKHTKSDPTPPAAGHAHVHGSAAGFGALSAQRLSCGPFIDGSVGASAGAGDSENAGESAGASSEREKEREKGRERSARMRLAFADYLIKPVQRVCKYPLLFEQLRASGQRKEGAPSSSAPTPTDECFATAAVANSTEDSRKRIPAAFRLGGDSDDSDEDLEEADAGDTDAAIERALRAMRGVAHAVDEARRRRELENKSRLIVDRLVAGTPGSEDAGVRDDTQGSVEDGGDVQTHSELGHGGAGSVKPPVRSLSFSSAFSRSRSRAGFGRTGFIQQQVEGVVTGAGGSVNPACRQIPGPPSRTFLASLGTCLLAGTLDVVVCNLERAPKATRREGGKRDSMLSITSGAGRAKRPVSLILQSGMGMGTAMSIGVNNGMATVPTFISPSREPVKVKYLAAFLYVGGYVILSKTPKAGLYEARHWFSLGDGTIEILDVREDEALLPCSFHLVFHSTGHRLELAAACQREKELWLNAIHHARSMPPVWEREPMPTLNISASLVAAAQTRHGADIPLVPSIPSTLDSSHFAHMQPSREASSSTLRAEATVKPRPEQSRRQSLNGSGMRAFFMNSSEGVPTVPPTVLIRRASATRRAQTDRHLADVLSQPLLAARLHAKTHDEVLFRDPDRPQQGAGIGVGAMAKNKLMARESVLVSKQCVQSMCASVDHLSTISDSASSVTVQRQASHVLRGKPDRKGRNRLSLGIHLTLTNPLADMSARDSRTSTSSHGPFSPDSPMQSTSTSTSHSPDPLSHSQCSSVATSAPASSPVNELFLPDVRVVGIDGPPELPSVLDPMDRLKRSRSFVDNFKGFFWASRSLSPSPATSSSSSRQASMERGLNVSDAYSGRQKNVLSRIWKNASRGWSSSDVLHSVQLASSSSDRLSPPRIEPVHSGARPSFVARSSSLLVVPHRRPERSEAEVKSRPSQHFLSMSSSNHPNTVASRSTPGPADAYRHKSLSRSIKYRLFPGSLVPLTPMEIARE